MVDLVCKLGRGGKGSSVASSEDQDPLALGFVPDTNAGAALAALWYSGGPCGDCQERIASDLEYFKNSKEGPLLPHLACVEEGRWCGSCLWALWRLNSQFQGQFNG